MLVRVGASGGRGAAAAAAGFASGLDRVGASGVRDPLLDLKTEGRDDLLNSIDADPGIARSLVSLDLLLGDIDALPKLTLRQAGGDAGLDKRDQQPSTELKVRPRMWPWRSSSYSRSSAATSSSWLRMPSCIA
jgi:hypothetical protein